MSVTLAKHSMPTQIIVFVEDDLTREYLNIIWADRLSQIKTVTAGNLGAVKSLVSYYCSIGEPCWGVIDRDYRWDSSHYKNSVVTLEKHEIENYLLNSEAICNSTFNCRKKLSVADIQAKIDAFIVENKFWFTCCRLLSSLNLMINRQFPPYPVRTRIINLQNIIEYLNTSCYYNLISEKLKMIEPTKVDNYVNQIIQEIDALYSKNLQLDFFPGKEIFRNIRGILPGSNYADKLRMDIDFAKEIAEFQVNHNQIPEEFDLIKHKILN